MSKSRKLPKFKPFLEADDLNRPAFKAGKFRRGSKWDRVKRRSR